MNEFKLSNVNNNEAILKEMDGIIHFTEFRTIFNSIMNLSTIVSMIGLYTKNNFLFIIFGATTLASVVMTLWSSFRLRSSIKKIEKLAAENEGTNKK